MKHAERGEIAARNTSKKGYENMPKNKGKYCNACRYPVIL
jgi:hypothetical protein